MLASLRLVLHTVTQRFSEDQFLWIPLMSKTPSEIEEAMQCEDLVVRIRAFLAEFTRFVEEEAD